MNSAELRSAASKNRAEATEAAAKATQAAKHAKTLKMKAREAKLEYKAAKKAAKQAKKFAKKAEKRALESENLLQQLLRKEKKTASATKASEQSTIGRPVTRKVRRISSRKALLAKSPAFSNGSATVALAEDAPADGTDVSNDSSSGGFSPETA